MCTLTWKQIATGYQIHFNRDEMRRRPIAIAPRVDRDAVYPIDPAAGGTWISANKFGLALALINNYRAERNFVHDAPRSRGLVVKDLSQSQSIDEIFNRIDSYPWQDFQPFDLFIFSAKPQSLYQISWDGVQQNLKIPQESMAFSAGFDTNEVTTSRRELLQAYVGRGKSLEQYHASHWPHRGHLSVCMHRQEAHTVSYTRVLLENGGVEMSYRSGPPCRTNLFESHLIL